MTSVKKDQTREKQFITSIYLTELVEQCNFTLLSMAYLRFALSTGNEGLVFFSAHTFLSHIGNISKLLWPDHRTKGKWPKSYDRDKELRGVLEVPENSPLKDRLFRNHYEHYDSRIDEWVFNSKHHNYVDKLIGPLSTIKGVDIGDIMRHFDPNTFTLTFRGDIYDLLSTEKEIIKLMNKIRELPSEIKMFMPISYSF